MKSEEEKIKSGIKMFLAPFVFCLLSLAHLELCMYIGEKLITLDSLGSCWFFGLLFAVLYRYFMCPILGFITLLWSEKYDSEESKWTIGAVAIGFAGIWWYNRAEYIVNYERYYDRILAAYCIAGLLIMWELFVLNKVMQIRIIEKLSKGETKRGTGPTWTDISLLPESLISPYTRQRFFEQRERKPRLKDIVKVREIVIMPDPTIIEQSKREFEMSKNKIAMITVVFTIAIHILCTLNKMKVYDPELEEKVNMYFGVVDIRWANAFYIIYLTYGMLVVFGKLRIELPQNDKSAPPQT